MALTTVAHMARFDSVDSGETAGTRRRMPAIMSAEELGRSRGEADLINEQ